MFPSHDREVSSPEVETVWKNGLFETRRSGPAPSKNLFKTFLWDVVPLSWNIHYEKVYDEESLRVHPMRMKDAPEEYKKRITSETVTGHFMSPANTLLVHRLTNGFEDSKDFEMRMLAYYIDAMRVDPYVMINDGNAVKVTCEDGMCATRILGMINYATIRRNFGSVVPICIHEKLLPWLLYDPWVRLKKFKDMVSLYRLYALSASTGGMIVTGKLLIRSFAVSSQN